MFYFLIIISISVGYIFIEHYLNHQFVPAQPFGKITEQPNTEERNKNTNNLLLDERLNKDSEPTGNNKKYRCVKRKVVVCEELKKYNQQLSRALRTLEYISVMQLHTNARTAYQTKELQDLKVNIQHEVLRLTKKIKKYQPKTLNKKVA